MNGGAAELERFRVLVHERLGLVFDDTKRNLLATTLRRRAEATGYHDSVYLERLSGEDGAGAELRRIAQELTVTETYFFRAADQIRAFVELALPHHLQAAGGTRKVRVLCAGCASGEEPYSLAMAIRDHLPWAAREVSIVAVDVNPAMLQKAKRALYSGWSLRELSEAQKQQWFRPLGSQFELDPGVRDAVAFQERNLARENPDLWQPGSWDIVFCRNTIMYFDAGLARRIVRSIADGLAPDGYLFLGHAETLRGLSDDFELCDTHGTFYYRRAQAPRGAEAAFVAGTPVELAGGAPEREPQPVDAAAWTHAIESAARRIDTLAEASRMLADRAPAKMPALEPDLGPVVRLLQEERYREALAWLAGLPPAHARRADTLLLRAVSALHAGALDLAERASRELLELDGRNPGAHYVLALCREGGGDLQGAEDEDRLALQAEPGFAMARLHIGLLARRRNDPDAAREALARALDALRSEPAARLALFGGGFGREALVALCEAELSRCGVA